MRKTGYPLNRGILLLLLVLSLIVSACSSSSAPPAATTGEQTPANVKKMPDELTKVKVALLTINMDTLPWYLAQKKEMFKKYNLDVEFTLLDTGPNGLRALQTGDVQFVMGLPEPFITGAAEGAGIKVIGAMITESLYSVYVTPEIQSIADLRGKVAAGLAPGNGTDLLIGWLLRKHGMEPDKDVRIIAAGGNPSRMQALKTGQAQMTLLSPPNDQVAEAQGLKRLTLMRDEIPNYNHEVIISSNKYLNERPEVARALIAATSDAIAYIKNEANREEVIAIGVETLKTSKESLTASLNFAASSFADHAKLNMDGLNLAIDILKKAGNLKTDIKVQDFVDERYYSE